MTQINRKKIDKLCIEAERLGMRVMHIHADVKRPGEPARIKIEFADKGKK